MEQISNYAYPLFLQRAYKAYHAWTISALQLHPDGIVACDEAACGELKVDTYKYFKEIYKNEK